MKFVFYKVTIALASLFLQSCPDKIDVDFVELRFALPYSIEPNRVEYKIGDTLWLSANFPDTVYEFLSKDHIKVIDYGFPTYLGFRKLISKDITLSQQPGAAASFEVVNKLGKTTTQFETFNPIEIIYENGHYKCLIGIIPTQVGVFCINFLSPKEDAIDFSSIDLGYNSKGIKRRGYYTQFYYVINSGETNVDLLRANNKLSSDNPMYMTSSNLYYEQKGTFTFKVVQ